MIHFPKPPAKLRPIDRRVLDALAARKRPCHVVEVAAAASVSVEVARAALNRLVVLGWASRVMIAGDLLASYAARACAICGAFVADLPHTCHGEAPADSFNVWRPGDFLVAVTGAFCAVGLVVLVLLIMGAFQ
jgi:hypothetical protein